MNASDRTRAGWARDRLKGKVALVTGAGQGIGRATVKRLAEEGAAIGIVELNEGGAKRCIDDVAQFGAEADIFLGDLTQWESAQRMVAWALERWGRIDILVNNVGGATDLKPFHEWLPEDLVAEVHRSLLPTLYCCRAVLPHMIGRGYGRIVNLGAESVRNGLWDRAPYSAGKGGVHALTTSIARETAELGITCNCVAPAHTLSERDRLVARSGKRQLSEAEKAHRASLAQRTMDTLPMRRFAEPEEQAAAVVFLASDDASYITGQVLSVNGGSSML